MIFTAESLHPKQWVPFVYLYILWIQEEKYSESYYTPLYRWEILIPIDQEDTKLKDKNTYVVIV